MGGQRGVEAFEGCDPRSWKDAPAVYGKAAEGPDLEEGPGVMSGDRASAAAGDQEQSLEAGLLLPPGNTAGALRWESGSGRDPARNGKRPGCGGGRGYPGLSW